MIRYNFKNVSREALVKIVQDGIAALSDKKNYDTFTLTLNTDCDESDVEVIKEEK